MRVGGSDRGGWRDGCLLVSKIKKGTATGVPLRCARHAGKKRRIAEELKKEENSTEERKGEKREGIRNMMTTELKPFELKKRNACGKKTERKG